MIDGSFYFGDYENNLSYSMGQRKDISIVPDIIYVSEAGMERLTSAPIISGIGIDIKDMNQLEEIDSELQALNGTLTKDRMELSKSGWNNRRI